MSWYGISCTDRTPKNELSSFPGLCVHNITIQNVFQTKSYGYLKCSQFLGLCLGAPQHQDFLLPFFPMGDDISKLERRSYVIKSQYITKIILQNEKKKKIKKKNKKKVVEK